MKGELREMRSEKENKLSSVNTRLQKRDKKEEIKNKKRKRKRRRVGGEDSTRACRHTRARESAQGEREKEEINE